MTPPSPKVINPATCAQRVYIDDACAEAQQCATVLGPDYYVVRTEYIAPTPQADGPFAYTRCDVRYGVWGAFFNLARRLQAQQRAATSTPATAGTATTPTAHRTGTTSKDIDTTSTPTPTPPRREPSGGAGQRW